MSNPKNSVLKGMKPRLSGNIETKQTFEEKPKSNIKDIVENVNKSNSNSSKEKKRKYDNQTHQIKTSAQLKEEINALKSITKTKFDYEVLELLIDSYNKNEFTPIERRKFKALTSDDF